MELAYSVPLHPVNPVNPVESIFFFFWSRLCGWNILLIVAPHQIDYSLRSSFR